MTWAFASLENSKTRGLSPASFPGLLSIFLLGFPVLVLPVANLANAGHLLWFIPGGACADVTDV